MKKLLASLLAASTVLSLSASAFASYSEVGNASGAAAPIVDSDGDSIDAEKGATVSFDLDAGGVFDVIHPDQTFYIPLGPTSISRAGNWTYVIENGTGNGITIPSQFFADKDLFKLSTKDKDGDASKLIKIYQEDSKTIKDAPSPIDERFGWLEVVVGDTMTSDEMKGTMTLEFKPQRGDLAEAIYDYYSKGNGGGLNSLKTEVPGVDTADKDDAIDLVEDWVDEMDTFKVDMTFWVNNVIEDGEDADVDAGDAFVYNPVSNEENLVIWNTENGERAALKFDADDDADKFYAKLSIKSNSSIYAEYGDPVGADLWFYDFVGSSAIPATSRATLTLGIPWDEDDDYVPASPEDCYIYRLNSDGTLEDVTSSFTYDEDGDIDGWYTRTRELGTFIVSDLELDIDVAGAEEVTDPDEVVDTETPDKVIPDTGSSDMVNVAVVAGVVSLAAAGAVAFRKVK